MRDEIVAESELQDEIIPESELITTSPIKLGISHETRPAQATISAEKPQDQGIFDKGWNYISGIFSDPDKEAARMTQALVDSEAFGISPSVAYDYRDMLESGVKINAKAAALRSTVVDRLKQRWDIGVDQTKISYLRSRQLEGDNSQETEDAIQELKRKQPTDETRFIPRSELEKTAGAFLQMLPFTAEVGIEANKQGLEMGMVTGTAGALATAYLGPGEVLTMPVTFGTGYAIGSVSKAMEHTGRLEAGGAYDELLNLGVDDSVARPVSMGIGAINGLLEVAGIDAMVRAIPGLRDAAKKALSTTTKDIIKSNVMKDIAIKYGKNYVTAIGEETTTELSQEISNIVGEKIAANLHEQMTAQHIEVDANNANKVIARLKETATETIRSMIMMGAPGTAYGIAHKSRSPNAKAIGRVQEVFNKVKTMAKEAGMSDATADEAALEAIDRVINKKQSDGTENIQTSGNLDHAHIDDQIDRVVSGEIANPEDMTIRDMQDQTQQEEPATQEPEPITPIDNPNPDSVGIQAQVVTDMLNRTGLDTQQRIQVVQDESEIPQHIRDDAARIGVTGRIEGVFDDQRTDKIYMVANGLSQNRVMEVVAHELIHRGEAETYTRLFGSMASSVKQQIMTTHALSINEIMTQNEGMDLNTAYREFIAQQGEGIDLNPSAVRKAKDALADAYAYLRNQLRRLGFVQDFTDADLAHMLRRMIETGATREVVPNRTGQPRFSLTEGQQGSNVEPGGPHYERLGIDTSKTAGRSQELRAQAQALLRGIDSTATRTSRHTNTTAATEADSQSIALKKLAQELGLLFDNAKFLSAYQEQNKSLPEPLQGVESKVVLNEGYAVKSRQLVGNDTYVTIDQAIAIHNLTFPRDVLEFLGFMEDGSLRIILQQPEVVFKTDENGDIVRPSHADIDQYMKDRMWEVATKEESPFHQKTWIDRETGVMITDLSTHGKTPNVAYDEGGNIRFIDPKIVVPYASQQTGYIREAVSMFSTRQTNEGNQDYSRTLFSIRQRDKKVFSDSILKMMKGNYPDFLPIPVMSSTPPILKALGFNDVPILMRQKDAKKSIADKHSMISVIENAADYITNPLLIFDGTDEGGGIAAISDKTYKGSPILAAVHPDKQVMGRESNLIVSIYGKEISGINEWLEKGNPKIRYVDTKKLKNLNWPGFQLFYVEQTLSNQGSDINILTEKDIVKESNPLFSTRKTDSEGNPIFDVKQSVSDLLDMVRQGEAGGRVFAEGDIGGDVEVSGYSSTYPEFMQNRGWTKTEVVAAIEKAMSRKPITENQREIYMAALAQAQGIYLSEIAQSAGDFLDVSAFYDKGQELSDAAIEKAAKNIRMVKPSKESVLKAELKETQATIGDMRSELESRVRKIFKLEDALEKAKTQNAEQKAKAETEIARLRGEIKTLARQIKKTVSDMVKASRLESTIPTQDVKKQIRRATGQITVGKMIGEDVALRETFRQSAMAARKAFVEGKREQAAKHKAEMKQIILQQDRVRKIAQMKNLKKIENLRQAMALPTPGNMTPEQLDFYVETLMAFEDGDVFLGTRQLETVVNVPGLEDIKTWREAKEALVREINRRSKPGEKKIFMDDLKAIKVSEWDEYRYDTALADRNPFYKMMVEETHRELLEAEARYHEVEKKVAELARASERSRKRTLAERAIPQDEQIFDYIEAEDDVREALRKNMTPQQVAYAEYIRGYFADALDYLIKVKNIEKGRENYFTHMRRTFLEHWKEDGLVSALKGLYKDYQMQEMVFNILDENTGMILPLNKFFQYTLRRTGELTPSKNVTKVFLNYARTLERKVSLDRILPKMDIYAQALTPEKKTKGGLPMKPEMIKFVYKYINNKKGRTITWAGKQGGKIDMTIRAIKTFTTMRDLGLNIPAGAASFVGEQTTDFIGLGVKNYAKGTARMATSKGQAIISKYENFVGQSIWEKLTLPGKQANERLMEGMFGLFHAASRMANAQYLLGSLTDAEYNSGTINPERLAEIQLDMGRWRVVENSKSLVGSTSAGSAFMQYKTWAIPTSRTLIKDISSLVRSLKNKRPGEALTIREAQELYRLVGMTSVILIVGSMAMGDDDGKDQSFIAQLIRKMYRESLTVLQAMDPTMWTGTPRIWTFLNDIGNGIKDLVTMQEYKTKEGNKGVSELGRAVTPRIIENLTKDDED